MNSILERYHRDFSQVIGYFYPEAAALWDTLLNFQSTTDLTGDFLEIGVFHGKSAALSTLHSRDTERCVFVDPYLREDVRALLGSIKPGNSVFAEMLSREYRRKHGESNTFRWIHIDGDHSGPAIINDLEIADALIADKGIVVLDDFLSACWPQITWATFRWLEAHPLRLHLFLCGFNKAYLCRPYVFPIYAKFVKDRLCDEMEQRGQKVTIWHTLNPLDMNCFGISQRFQDLKWHVPDSDRGWY